MMIETELRPIATFKCFRHTPRMATKFHGTHQELQDKLLPLDLDGDWEPQPNSVWKFKCRDRSGLLWSETKGTLRFDGPEPAKSNLAAKVEAISGDAPAKTTDTSFANRSPYTAPSSLMRRSATRNKIVILQNQDL